MEGEFLKRIEELGSRLWEQRRRDLPRELAEQGERTLLGCRGEEAPVLRWELATLPLWDLGEYGPELFLGEARQALAAREEFPWGRELPDALFLREVACPRVNNEGLAPCRELFRGELAPRVRGLSLEEAILEVNRWCAGKVTYRASDDRTASALEVVRRGYGRCGEESLFLVNALRSVAIPARQVYAPWWSHCDDNHAWVEAWDGNAWRYLGACEPEPVLDRGWFTGAAARAMLLHARSFYPGDLGEGAFLYPGVDPLDLDQREGVVYESLTHRYGDTVPLRVTVTDESGKPRSRGEGVFLGAEHEPVSGDRRPGDRAPGNRRAPGGERKPGGGCLPLREDRRLPGEHRGGPGSDPGPGRAGAGRDGLEPV